MLHSIFSDLQPAERIYIFQKEIGKPVQRRLLGSVDDVAGLLTMNGHTDLYFGVGIRSYDSFDTVVRVPCAYIDIDLDCLPANNRTFDALTERVALFPFKPSFVVHSGHGFHVYWLYTKSVAPDLSQQICRGIVSKVKGADSAHDPERILRIPGTKNWKDPEQPKDVELFIDEPGRRYDPEDVLALTRLPDACLEVISTGSEKDFKSRSERDWYVIRTLIASGVSEQAIRTIAEQKPVGDRWREDNFRLLDIDLGRANNAYYEGTLKFSEAKGMLFYEGQKGSHQVATFVFDPERILRSQEGVEDSVFGTIRTATQEWPGVVLPRSSMSSSSNMLKHMTAMEWQWLGNDYETKQYLMYLMAKLQEKGMPEATATFVIGRHERFWVTKTDTLGVDKVYTEDAAPFLYADRKNRRKNAIDTAPSTQYTFPDDCAYRDLLLKISPLLPKLNVRGSILPVLGWFAAAPLRSVFNAAGMRFPILNVFGTMGSGKTSLLVKALMPLLGVVEAHTNASNTTRFVLRMLLSQTNGLPIIFGEYRESTVDPRSDLCSLLRMLYDTGMDSRGHADQSTETYMLEAPVIVDGEDSLADPALKQRSITVNLHPESIVAGTEQFDAFKEFVTLPIGDFAGRYIQRTLTYGEGAIQDLFGEMLIRTQEVFTRPLPDRVRNNIAVVGCGLEILNQHLKYHQAPPIEWGMEDLQDCVHNVVLQLSTGSPRTLVDDFVEDMIAFVANVQNTRLPFIGMYSIKDNIFWFHFSSAHQWWSKEQRIRGKSQLEGQAMQAQLVERSKDAQGYALPMTIVEISDDQRLQMYGINLKKAQAAGLAVPNVLSAETLLQKYGITLRDNVVVKAAHNTGRII